MQFYHLKMYYPGITLFNIRSLYIVYILRGSMLKMLILFLDSIFLLL